MYYPTIVQPTSTGGWPNMYQINTQQPQQVPAIYYQAPPVSFPPNPTTTTTSEIVAQQQQPQTTSTTKITTTRILDATTLPSINTNSVVEETKTTNIITKPEAPAASTIITSTATNVPQVTTTTVAPTVETTTIREKPRYQTRRIRTLSTSTYSDDTATSTESTITPQPKIIQQQQTVLPIQAPIQTTTIIPPRRIIHQTQRLSITPSGYYSSDLDYGKRKVYKTDYKYRHYYCCNWCKGRCDLRNRSYGCCEWFYGCPVWAFIIFGLFFLALLITFLTLFGLQPSINSTRRSDTAETRLLNRTQIVYGFYENCGYQVNATNTPTTLILCTNTATTTTARIQLSSFYTILSRANSCSYNEILILFCYLFISKKLLMFNCKSDD